MEITFVSFAPKVNASAPLRGVKLHFSEKMLSFTSDSLPVLKPLDQATLSFVPIDGGMRIVSFAKGRSTEVVEVSGNETQLQDLRIQIRELMKRHPEANELLESYPTRTKFQQVHIFMIIFGILFLASEFYLWEPSPRFWKDYVCSAGKNVRNFDSFLFLRVFRLRSTWGIFAVFYFEEKIDERRNQRAGLRPFADFDSCRLRRVWNRLPFFSS